MLALSNGAKGIFFEPYYSYTSWLPETSNIFVEAIVDTMDAQGNFPPRDIYYRIQQLTARLKGKLGATLNKLKHTTYSVNSTYPVPGGDTQITGYEYFQLINQNNNNNYYYDWYAGFMYDSMFTDRNYFLITNLRTEVNKTANFSITNTTGYDNLGLFDVEDNSSTINTTLAKDEVRNFNVTVPAGEGYLFQVAPVVLYGGKLVYNETVGDGMTLYDDMSIESGATLSVYHTYLAKSNIIVKSGGRIDSYENGKIIFDPGKKLIIEGTAEINGTANNRLTLEFSSATSEGIVVKPGGALYLSYADVKNAQIGVKAEVGSGQINISNVNFTNCSSSGIALLVCKGMALKPRLHQLFTNAQLLAH